MDQCTIGDRIEPAFIPIKVIDPPGQWQPVTIGLMHCLMRIMHAPLGASHWAD